MCVNLLRCNFNVVYRVFVHLTRRGRRGESGISSPVPIHSRFNQPIHLIYLNIILAESDLHSIGRSIRLTFDPIDTPMGNGYALPGTGITVDWI